MAYGGAVLALLALFGVWFQDILVDEADADLRERVRLTASTVASLIDAEAYAEGVGDSLERLVVDDVSRITVLQVGDQPGHWRARVDLFDDAYGPSVASYETDPRPALAIGLGEPTVDDRIRESRLAGFAPIVGEDGAVLGVVAVEIDARAVAAARGRLRGVHGVMLLLTLTVLGVVTVALGQGSTPVAGRPLADDRNDDLGLLGRRLELMTKGMQEREYIRETFGRYVGHKVAETLLDDHDVMRLEGEGREVTVLSVALPGLLGVAERGHPVQIVALLNDYLGVMTDAVDRHQGSVVEFRDEGLLVVFGAPVRLLEHPERALRCAIALRARFDDLWVEWEKNGKTGVWQGEARPVLHTGVHSGRVVAGNLGTATRMKYAVIGDAVIVADSLRRLNRALGTQILVSADLVAHLPPDVCPLVDQGAHQLAGRTGEVRVSSC
jgi:adenylate cyclase